MEFNFIFIFLALIFFNHTYAICVPRNGSAPSPTSTSPAPQQSPTLASSPSSVTMVTKTNTNTQQQPLANHPILQAVADAIPHPGGDNNPAIKKICDSTDYPDVCQSTLGSFKGPPDVPSLLGAAIKSGIDFAKTALDTAQKMATQPGTPPDQASLFKDCKDSYDDASYNFQKAIDALPMKDDGTMKTMLSAAITDVGDCQDAFEGTDSPLVTYSDKLSKMASNCLAIISLPH